ncbi:MAG: hypothetical protein QXZ43_04515, partial [Candidatus Aenigmatarchaeota archaeon]
ADRWFVNAYGSSGGNITVTRQEFPNDGSGNGSRYYFEIKQTSTTSTNMWIYYPMESNDTKKFQGKTVTVSFRYRIPIPATNSWSFEAVSSTSENTKSVS